jgi:WD40 repeat protein
MLRRTIMGPMWRSDVYRGFTSLVILTLLLSGCTWMSGPTPAIPTPTATHTPQPTIAAQAAPVVSPTPTNSSTAANLEPRLLASLGQGAMPQIFRAPDGQTVVLIEAATPGAPARLRLLAADGQETGQLELHTGPVNAVQFSAAGRLAALTGIGGVQVIERQEPSTVFHQSGTQAWSRPVFAPDERYLAALRQVDGRTVLAVIDLGADQLLASLYDAVPQPISAAFNADSSLLAVAGGDKRLSVLELPSGALRFTLEHASAVTGAAFSPDGTLLASSSQDGTVRLWRLADGALANTFTGFKDSTLSVAFSPNGRQVHVQVAGQVDQLIDLQNGEMGFYYTTPPQADPLEAEFFSQGYSWPVDRLSLGFSPDGRQVALGSRGVQIWDLTTASLAVTLSAPRAAQLRSLAYSPDSRWVAAITDQEQVLTWDLAAGGAGGLLPTDANTARDPTPKAGLIFTPDGTHLAFGSGAAIEVWDLASAQLVNRFNSGETAWQVSATAFAADGSRLYAVLNSPSGQTLTQAWDVASQRLVRQLNLPPTSAEAPNGALRGALLARLAEEANGPAWIELWNLESGTFTRFPAPEGQTQLYAFSPDGRLLVGGANGRLFFWDAAAGQLVYQTQGSFAGPVVFSANGQGFADTAAGQLRLWDIQALQQAVLTPRRTPAAAPPTPVETPNWAVSPSGTAVKPQPWPSLPAGALTPENAAVAHEVGRFGAGAIAQAGWTPRGEALYVASSLGVYTYDPAALQARQQFPTDLPTASAVRLSNGAWLAATYTAAQIQVWNPTLGKQLANLPLAAELAGQQPPVLSPDGRLVVYAETPNTFGAWDLEAAAPVATLHNLGPGAHGLVFSPNSRLAAAIQPDGSARVWEVRSGRIVQALGSADSQFGDLAFSPDGQALVAVSGEAAWLWDLRPGLAPEAFPVCAPAEVCWATAAALSPTGESLAVSASDRRIYLLDRRTGGVLRTLSGQPGLVRQLSFSPDGARLLSVDADGRLVVWGAATGRQLAVNTAHSAAVSGLLFRGDGLLSAWVGNTAWTLNPQTVGVLHTTTIPTGTLLAASPDGAWLAVYQPFRMQLWEAQSGAWRLTLAGEPGAGAERAFASASFSADSQRLAVTGTGGAWLYQLPEGHLLQQISLNGALAWGALHPAGSLLAACQAPTDCQLGLWNLQTGQPVDAPTLPSAINLAAFTPDGLRLGLAANPPNAAAQFLLWDPAAGQLAGRLDLPNTTLTSLAFNPNSRLAALGQRDGHVLLVDLNGLHVLARLTGLRGAVTHLAFSPDGRYLAAAGGDGLVWVWSAP